MKVKLAFNLNLAIFAGFVNKDTHKTENLKLDRKNLPTEQYLQSLLAIKEIVTNKDLLITLKFWLLLSYFFGIKRWLFTIFYL